MDNSAVRSDPNVIYGETYMVTLINSTKFQGVNRRLAGGFFG